MGGSNIRTLSCESVAGRWGGAKRPEEGKIMLNSNPIKFLLGGVVFFVVMVCAVLLGYDSRRRQYHDSEKPQSGDLPLRQGIV